MKKLQRKFVDTLNLNMVDKIETRLFDLELKMEHAQRDLEELKELVKKLSFSIADLQLQIIDLIDSK